jgi:hypothetical protein
MSSSLPHAMSSLQGPLLSAAFAEPPTCSKKSKKKKHNALNGHNGKECDQEAKNANDFQFHCQSKPELYQFTAVSTESSFPDLFLDEISGDDPRFIEHLSTILGGSRREDQEAAYEAFIATLSQFPPDQHKSKGKQLCRLIAKKLTEIEYESDSEQSLVSTPNADCDTEDKDQHLQKEEVRLCLHQILINFINYLLV